MSDDRERLAAEILFLETRMAEMRAELKQTENYTGIHVTRDNAPMISEAVAGFLRVRGNAALAERYAAAYQRYATAVLAWGADEDNQVAQAAADDAEEEFDRVQADTSAFLRSLPDYDDDEKGGA